MAVVKFLAFLILSLVMGELVVVVVAVSLERDLSMTFREKQALDKFRNKVEPLLKTEFMKRDIYLIRWLRARNFDVNAAEAMLKENLRWREENKMDGILTEDFSDMFKDYPSTMDTYDREGRPVAVIDVGEWNIRETVISGKGPRLLRYLDMLLENGAWQIFERQQRGMNVTQTKTLANAESFNMITQGCPICIPLWTQFLDSVDRHYAGWSDEFIIIEAPTAVYTVINVLRQFLSPSTRDTLKIFGMNKAVWMPYLDSKISRDQRRANYGGTKPPIERH